jgi:hypothetical protein
LRHRIAFTKILEKQKWLKMNQPFPDLHFRKRLIIGVFRLIAAFTSSGVLFADAQQTLAPAPKPRVNSDTPTPSSSGKRSGNAAPEDSQINQRELELLTKAADKVLNRIQSAENDLYLRVNYFEKPNRLNPNSYASKEEVAQWQGILQQLREKHEFVAQLYADVGRDLDTELRKAGANEDVVARFKNFVMNGFPWATIEKKKKLITDFIDEQAALLSFYEKNWGSWDSAADSNKPKFTSAPAANIYKKLRDQILNTSAEIEKEYKEMSE